MEMRRLVGRSLLGFVWVREEERKDWNGRKTKGGVLAYIGVQRSDIMEFWSMKLRYQEYSQSTCFKLRT
jgi:hypothetical protein